MGHGNLSMKKRSRQFHLLDLASAAIFLAVAVFFLLVFTPFGDSVAASGRRALALSGADSGQRERLVELVSDGQPLLACSADVVHRVPCEDPRRERRCPSPEDTLLCLVPPPRGYRIPISWPDSLSKVANILLFSFLSTFPSSLSFLIRRCEAFPFPWFFFLRFKFDSLFTCSDPGAF